MLLVILLVLYRAVGNVVFPTVLFIRKLKKIETPTSFRQKKALYNDNNEFKKKDIIWFHGVSVGEVNSIFYIIDLIYTLDRNFLITTTTLSSQSLVKQYIGDKSNIIHRFLPLDKTSWIKRFLNEFSITKAFFMESEIWPNLLFICSKRGIAVSLLNARISDRSFKRWQLPIVRILCRKILLLFYDIQTDTLINKEKFLLLGAKKVNVIGNLKCLKKANIDKKIKDSLIKYSVSPHIFFSSIHLEDFTLVTRVLNKLKEKDFTSSIILAPRHMQRCKELSTLFPNSILLSQFLKNPTSLANKILIVDLMGKLDSIYSMNPITYLGGGLLQRGGHNPVEAAIFGCFIVIGSDISNSYYMSSMLKKRGALVIGHSIVDISDTLIKAIVNQKEHQLLGKKNAILVAQKRKIIGDKIKHLFSQKEDNFSIPKEV